MTELKKLSGFVVMYEKKVREPCKTFEFTEIEKNDRGFKNDRITSTKSEVQLSVSILGSRKGAFGTPLTKLLIIFLKIEISIFHLD